MYAAHALWPQLVAFDIVARRKEEASALQAALDAALGERDARSSVMLDDYERGRKAAAVMAATRPGDAEQLARAMLAEGATGWVVPVVHTGTTATMTLHGTATSHICIHISTDSAVLSIPEPLRRAQY